MPSTWSAVLAVSRVACGASPPSPGGLSVSLSWRRILGHLKLRADPPVYDELVVVGRGRPGAEAISRSTWIRNVHIDDRTATQHFPNTLGQGGREAIVLAQERQITLLLDDQRAGQEAENRGVEAVGVLWVLGQAKRRGFVTEVRPIIDELLAMGYWLHPEHVIRPFLEEMGET